MPGPPPTPELADLANLLGLDNVRVLIRTYLQEYPQLFAQLRTGDRKTRHRVAHSLKSNLRVIGAKELSAQMAALEARLAQPDKPDLAASEMDALAVALERTAEPLRVFVAPE